MILPALRLTLTEQGLLIANLIEQVSGQRFEQFMEEQVFTPAGLTRTRVFNLMSKSEAENRAIGFKKVIFNKIKIRDLNQWDGVAGDGGIYSTTEELLEWHKSLMRGDIIPTEFYQQAMRFNPNTDSLKQKYGFGWFILSENEVEHAGGWQGFSSYFYRNEKSDSIIVVLDNASHSLQMAPYGTRWNSMSLNLRQWLNSQVAWD